VLKFNFSNLAFISKPYVIGCATEVFEPEVYQAMVNAFPSEKIFATMGQGYNKKALSERCNPEAYQQAIKKSKIWVEFWSCIKSKEFIVEMFKVMALHNIIFAAGDYSARFEFSSLPCHGGGIDPHRDIPSKVLTLIVPILADVTSWNPAWGGGTDVLEPIDLTENLKDYEAPLHKFNKIATFEYQSNRATVFIRSENSWHSVGPIRGPEGGPSRRTLTINIEKHG
jgi:hypothetical protein